MLAKISWRLLLILVSAGTIAFLTYQYLDSLQETTTIVVAETRIPEQTEIKEDMLTTVTVEAQAADTLLTDRVMEIESVVGAITREEISKDEPLQMDPDLLVFPEDRDEYLTEDGRVDLGSFIPDDQRLYTLALEPHAAVDNRLEKGDYVDVIHTAESVEHDEVFSRMIIQYAEVYDVESFDDSDSGNLGKDGLIQHVTLMVSPQEAVALATSKEEGQLSLVLNPSHGDEVDVGMIYESTLEN